MKETATLFQSIAFDALKKATNAGSVPSTMFAHDVKRKNLKQEQWEKPQIR